MIPKLTGFPARYWWVLLVSGILALVAGVIVLVWPGRTRLTQIAPVSNCR